MVCRNIFSGNYYLFRKLFHPLTRRASFPYYRMRGYRGIPMVKLDENKIRWIIQSKNEKVKNLDISVILKITPRRVQQVYSQYKKTKKIPTLKRPGRPKKPVTVHEIELVKQVQEKFHTNALYLEKIISKLYNTKINHNRIHKIMLDEGLSVEQPRKKMRRKWIRYEREYSNSLWHTDWHTIHDSRWAGKQLIAFEDDASRFITGFGVYDEATSVNSSAVLSDAIKNHGRPASVLSDNGKQFTSNVNTLDHNKPVDFEQQLMRHHVKHSRTRVRHPQTNGKLEKFWDIFECKIEYFESVEQFMHWYNHIRVHGALDLDNMETPSDAYHSKMITNEILIDPSILWRNYS